MMEIMEEESTLEPDIKLYDCYSSSSESDEEDDKMNSVVVGGGASLKQNQCCLLCGQLAVIYDLEGHVVKREHDDEDEDDGSIDIEGKQQFSYQDLFSSLCRCFKVKKKEWSFPDSDSKDSFPFCTMCEFLLTSVAEVYCRLDELEELIRAKMVEAEEEKFWKEGLYRKHNERYATFRKQVLKEKFKGNAEQVDEDETHSAAAHKKSRISSVVVAKSEVVDCGISSSFSEVEPGPCNTSRQLRSRSCKMARKEIITSLSHDQEKVESDMDMEFSSDNDEPEVALDDLVQSESQSSSISATTSEDDADSDFNPKTEKRFKRKVKTSDKPKSSDPLSNTTRTRGRRKGIPKPKPMRRVTNPLKPKNSTWKGDNMGYIVKDPETGNINYSTGYGNRFRSTRTVLQFSKLGSNQGYQCCTCLDVIPFESHTLKQQSRFRVHFIKTHSPRYTCRLCPNPSRCSSSEELLQHVVSEHNLPNLQAYNKMVMSFRIKENCEKRAELRKKKEFLYSKDDNCCKVCGMPYSDLEKYQIWDHNKSHLNVEEVQEIEQMDNNLSLIKTYQCTTCGKTVRGLLGLRSHEKTHINGKTVCPICGLAFTKLDLHISSAHGERRSLSLRNRQSQCTVCKMPFFNLQKSVIREHKNSHLSQEERQMRAKKYRASCNKMNCKVCDMPFASMGLVEIRMHRQSHKNSQEEEEIQQMSGGDLQRQPEKKFQCSTCGKILANKTSLLTHDQTHQIAQYVCSICGETYKRQSNLDSHMEKVHPDGTWIGPYCCNYPSCGNSLDTDSNLAAHVEKEHSNSEEARKRLMCIKCGRVLASSWVLKLHGLVHSKERSFKCDICSKTYPLKATLENHLAEIHSIGSKCAAFKCNQPGCGVEYRSDKYLKSHLRRVHGVFVRKCKSKT